MYLDVDGFIGGVFEAVNHILARSHCQLHDTLVESNEFDWKSLLFDLVDRTGFAIVFAEYTFAPEAQFPVQQEQLLDVLQWVVKNGHSKGLKADKIAMVGDSAGGTFRPWHLRLCMQR